MINDEIRDNDENTTLDDKRKIIAPTIGDAVKEAVKTGEEVLLQGETFAGEPTGITENVTMENDEQKGKEKGKEDEVILYSTTTSADSEMEVGVAELMEEVSPVEDQIVIDKGEVKDSDEVTIAPITSIPVEEAGVEVEVQTEIEVPVDDKDKEVESQIKLKVESENLSKELLIDPPRTKTLDEKSNEIDVQNLDDEDDIRPPVFDKMEKSFEDSLDKTKDNVERYAEIMSKVKDTQSTSRDEKYMEMQESFNKSLKETKNNVETKTEKMEHNNNNNNSNDNNDMTAKMPKSNNVNDMTATLFNESLQKCIDYQKQTFDAFRSFWETALKNYNIPLWNYWSMPGRNNFDMYAEMVKNYTNTVEQSTKLMNDMLFSFMNAFYKRQVK